MRSSAGSFWQNNLPKESLFSGTGFKAVLDKFYGGSMDEYTQRYLNPLV